MIIFLLISLGFGMMLSYYFGRLVQMQKNRKQVSFLMDELTDGKPSAENFGKFIGGLVEVATQDRRFGEKIGKFLAENTKVETKEEA